MKDNYRDLKKVLDLAYSQASEGKGRERHANDEPFTEQLIFQIEKWVKSFQLGQAIKKIVESQRLPKDRAQSELLGAINYICAHFIQLEPKQTLFEKHKKKVEVEKFSILQQLKNITEENEK
jgi:hypothetical protein